MDADAGTQGGLFWREAWALTSGLWAEQPSTGTLEALRDSGALEALNQLAEQALGFRLSGLDLMALALHGGTPAVEKASAEFLALFFGPGKMPAPPWESVYLSPERLVMREPAYQVLKRYAEAGLGYDGMTETPPDHVARELAFLAALHAPDAQVDDAEAKAAAFLTDHVARWVPRFCMDVEYAVPGGFYAALAVLVRELIEHRLPRLRQVA